MKNRIFIGLAILFVSIFATARAHAEGEELQPGVARVSVIHGDVSTQRGDSGDWVAASVNAPVVAGDRLSSGVRSRVEVQLDYANVLRLGGSTEAKIADLTRTHQQIQLSRGLLNFSVFKDSEADVEIDTVNVAIRPVGEGSYRVLVPSDDETQFIVRKGEADVTTPQGSTTVKKGQMITIRGRDNPEYQVADAPRTDDWDNWNKDRDHQIQDARSYSHTNRYYTGVSDLDGYGRWVYVPGYGMVWSPYGEPGWAPYRSGRWVWEPYWGWTWVSYEPWGWAPYHYGRWFLYSGSWCWWPGPVHRFYRPIWAPAYVSFFGFGHRSGFAIGFGFGSIGWLPIGPSDHFFPWWGGRGRNINVVNITNITNITNIRNVNPVPPLAGRGHPVMSNLNGMTGNSHLQRAVTSMNTEQFGRAAVPRDHRPVPVSELRKAEVITGGVPTVPTRESLRTVDRAANPATIRDHGDKPERFFTRTQPIYKPQPFNTEAAQVRETIERHQADQANRPGAGPADVANRPVRGDRAAQPPSAAPTNDQRPNRGVDDVRTNRGADEQRPARGTDDNVVRSINDQKARNAGNATPATGRDNPRTDTPRDPSTPGWRRFGDRSGPPRTDRTADAPSTGGQNQTPAARDQNTPRTIDDRTINRGRDQAPAREQNPRGDERPNPVRGRDRTPEKTPPPDQAQTPQRENSQSQAPGWRKFEGSAPARERSAEGSQTPRGNAPAERSSPARETTRPRENSRPEATPPPERRPSSQPPPEDRAGGWRQFTPQPERSASPRGESPRGDSVDRSGPSFSPGRGMERDRGPSSESRGPGPESRGPSARESAPRAERPALEMRRPIMTPRSAPSERQASPAPRRESSPPPRQQQSGGGRGDRPGGGRSRF